jgi:hypothetical protein
MYVLERLEAQMRVEDRVLKNVAFVGIETNGSFTPLGTGFLVRVRINDAIGSSYLVTADHVVEMKEAIRCSCGLIAQPAQEMVASLLAFRKHACADTQNPRTT